MELNLHREKLQKEAFEALEKSGFNGMVILPTGSGKGKVLVDVLKRLNPKRTLYLCDNKELRDTTFPDELRKWDAAHFINKIDFMCYAGARNMEGEKYDLLLSDEADYGVTPKYSQVWFNNTFTNKVLVSATCEASKRRIIKSLVPIVYEKIISDVVDDKVVNKEQVWFVNYELSPSENKRYLAFNEQFKRALSQEKVSQPYVRMIQRSRKQFLSSLVTGKNVCIDLLLGLYKNTANKILVFCGLSEQADKITKYSYHSKNESLDNLSKFNSGEARVMAVIGKLDRGVNLTGVNNIVFESPMESKTKFIQKSGRGRRLHVDDTLHMYFLIPYYRTIKGELKPTIVQQWVLNSTADLDLSTAKVYNSK